MVAQLPLVVVPTEQMHYFRIAGSIMHRYGFPGVPHLDHCTAGGRVWDVL